MRKFSWLETGFPTAHFYHFRTTLMRTYVNEYHVDSCPDQKRCLGPRDRQFAKRRHYFVPNPRRFPRRDRHHLPTESKFKKLLSSPCRISSLSEKLNWLIPRLLMVPFFSWDLPFN